MGTAKALANFQFTTLQPEGFEWETGQGKWIALSEMHTAYMFNTMKKLFNHLSKVTLLEPVDYTVKYKNILGIDPGSNPLWYIERIILFILEIEKREDLPEKYIEPYQKIIRQLLT